MATFLSNSKEFPHDGTFSYETITENQAIAYGVEALSLVDSTEIATIMSLLLGYTVEVYKGFDVKLDTTDKQVVFKLLEAIPVSMPTDKAGAQALSYEWGYLKRID